MICQKLQIAIQTFIEKLSDYYDVPSPLFVINTDLALEEIRYYWDTRKIESGCLPYLEAVLHEFYHHMQNQNSLQTKYQQEIEFPPHMRPMEIEANIFASQSKEIWIDYWNEHIQPLIDKIIEIIRSGA